MYLINSFFVIWSKWPKTKKISCPVYLLFFRLLKTSFNWEFFSLLTNKKFTFSVKCKQIGQLIFSFLVTLTKLQKTKNEFMRYIWHNNQIWITKCQPNFLFSQFGKRKDNMAFSVFKLRQQQRISTGIFLFVLVN